jgi:hypothetical protein
VRRQRHVGATSYADVTATSLSAVPYVQHHTGGVTFSNSHGCCSTAPVRQRGAQLLAVHTGQLFFSMYAFAAS